MMALALVVANRRPWLTRHDDGTCPVNEAHLAGDEPRLVRCEECGSFSDIPALPLPKHGHRVIARPHHVLDAGAIPIVSGRHIGVDNTPGAIALQRTPLAAY